jgi:hypothetical protein
VYDFCLQRGRCFVATGIHSSHTPTLINHPNFKQHFNNTICLIFLNLLHNLSLKLTHLHPYLNPDNVSPIPLHLPLPHLRIRNPLSSLLSRLHTTHSKRHTNNSKPLISPKVSQVIREENLVTKLYCVYGEDERSRGSNTGKK